MDSIPESRTPHRFLTLGHIADELNVSMSQVYALVRSGDLIGIQIGGRSQWRVERIKLEQYIAEAYRRAAASLTQLPDELPTDDAP